jgi:hypothetical protein
LKRQAENFGLFKDFTAEAQQKAYYSPPALLEAPRTQREKDFYLSAETPER